MPGEAWPATSPPRRRAHRNGTRANLGALGRAGRIIDARNALFNELGQSVGSLGSRTGLGWTEMGPDGSTRQFTGPTNNKWQTLYDNLGMEPVRIGPTGREKVYEGLRAAANAAGVPLKR